MKNYWESISRGVNFSRLAARMAKQLLNIAKINPALVKNNGAFDTL